jgi:hypothetical protein
MTVSRREIMGSMAAGLVLSSIGDGLKIRIITYAKDRQ